MSDSAESSSDKEECVDSATLFSALGVALTLGVVVAICLCCCGWVV